MRKSMILLGAAAGLAGCGQSADNAAANEAAANSAAAEAPRPAYCFFKKDETKGWAAKVDKDGNVVVSGKAYPSDGRYKAELKPAADAATSGDAAKDAPAAAPAS